MNKNNNFFKVSKATIAILAGVTLGVVINNATAEDKDASLSNTTVTKVALENTNAQLTDNLRSTENTLSQSSVVSLGQLQSEGSVENIQSPTLSYVNFQKDRITTLIRLYAILENCSIDSHQKDDITFSLSEYVTSSVQAEKYTSLDLKNEYISFTNTFQPPHPTDEDCIDSFKEAKELSNYWNEKKTTAYNELFSEAKNRYSPDPADNVDAISSEQIKIPNDNLTNNDYSIIPLRKMPWDFNSKDIFTSPNSLQSPSPLGMINDNFLKNNTNIPNTPNNTNKLAIIDNENVSPTGIGAK